MDEATITAKVKAAMLGEPALTVVPINAEPFTGVVQVSGFVHSPQVVTRSRWPAASAA